MAAKLLDRGTDGARQRIDRFELVAEIASGGMATVFLARLSGLAGFQRFVAIKRLHPHLAREKEFVEMFLDEARLAAGIHHPNVVSILEVGASERGYYLVMEYIEGDTLARLLARAAGGAGRMPHGISLRIGIDMLNGLHAAHELKDETGESSGLVHRDVSPQNILVGVDGVSRITDFGVARAASRLSATRVGQLKGKLAYMAPEQAAGEDSVDRRADVFSAGIVLWEAMAGRRLFKADNEAATLSRVMSEPIPRLADAVDIETGVSNVIMKALERDRSKRFPTCAQFSDALERAATGKSPMAPPRDIAAYVSSVVGTDIEAQRDAVRMWLARSEPSRTDMPISDRPPPLLPGSGSAAAMERRAGGAPQSAGSYPSVSGVAPVAAAFARGRMPIIAAAVGLVVLLLVGGIVLALRGGDHTAQAPSATATVVAAPKPAAPVAPEPKPGVVEPVASAEPAPTTETKPAAKGKAGKSSFSGTKPGGGDEPYLSNPYR